MLKARYSATSHLLLSSDLFKLELDKSWRMICAYYK